MIRSFDVRDIDGVIDIENKSSPKRPYDRGTIMAYSAIYSDSFLVYEEDEKILGYVIFEENGHVLSIAVDPSYRRRGIGTELMKKVVEKLKTAWIEVKGKNTIAQKFYESLGFKRKGLVKKYYKTDDGLIMVYEN
jgi:ribosomal-protein-alanine N-acetyltransferase